MSINRKLLEKEVESKRKNFESYRDHIVPKDDECISVLEAKKSEKEEELKNCYWMQYWAKSDISSEISRLRRRIEELKLLEKRERELEELVQQLHDIPGQGWGGYPGILDEKIADEYRKKFSTLSVPLTPEIPFYNIVMIGETGSGKSSFLRTFTTALTNNTDIKDIYRVCPQKSKTISATKQIHLENMYMGDEGLRLPCKFYDMPGIDKYGTIKKEDLDKILDGKIKLDVDSQTASEPANEFHCILYVVNAETNLKNMPESLKIMTEIQQERNHEDGVRQFVVVTSIDKLGVPNDDIKNAYKYPLVRKYCNDVSEAFGVDLFHVIPVSNYFEEVTPNEAKNAMSLFNLWRVFKSGKEYIERRWSKKETRFFGKDWTCTNA